MAGTFNFCPKSLVPELLPPEPVSGMSLNGWNFSSKPTVPFQRSWRVTLHGLRWFLNSSTGLFDNATQPTLNAKLLEEFYQSNGTWDSFTWTHPHITGALTVRFKSVVQIPAGIPNSGGLCNPVEVNFVEHNASW
jgi:hypothetical protein